MRLLLYLRGLIRFGSELRFRTAGSSQQLGGRTAQIRKAAERLVELYNAHDAKTLSSLFASDAELVQRDGTRIVG